MGEAHVGESSGGDIVDEQPGSVILAAILNTGFTGEWIAVIKQRNTEPHHLGTAFAVRSFDIQVKVQRACMEGRICIFAHMILEECQFLRKLQTQMFCIFQFEGKFVFS